MAGHPGGDVLDRALAAALTKTPAAPPGAKGFFDALKPQSPLFAQTARVNLANPSAQQRQQRRVVPAYVPPATPRARTPADQAEVDKAHQLLHGATPLASVVEHPVRTVEHVQQAYDKRVRSGRAIGPGPGPSVASALGTANTLTNRGVAALGKVGQAPDASHEASVNAGILNAAQGVPTASLTVAAQQKLRAAAEFFAVHPTYHYDVPDLGLFGPKDKAAYKLPPTATDADYVRALGNEVGGLGHRDYFSSLLHNVPLNAVQLAAAPVGLAYLGSQVAQGKTGAAKEFAREQVDFGRQLVMHPLDTLKKNPVTVATTLLGAGRLAGGLGGTAARTGLAGDAAKAFATPAERSVVPAGYSVQDAEGYDIKPPPINRGMTSTKLDERVAQAASDWAARNLPAVGKRLIAKTANDITRAGHRFSNDLQSKEVVPALKAATKVSPTELRAVTYAHGQGIKPSEMADYFEEQAKQHRGLEQQARNTVDSKGRSHYTTWQGIQSDLDKAATLWRKVTKKIGDTPSKRGTMALSAAKHASRSAEAQMTSQHLPGSAEPLLQPDTLLRRAYVPLARVRGVDPEDAAAMQQLRAEYRAEADVPAAQPGAPLDVHDPLYFPHVVEGPRGLAKIKRGQGLGRSSENVKPAYAGRLGKAGQQASGELFAQGRASSDPRVFFGAAAKPAKIAAGLRHLQNQVSAVSFKGEPGMAYDTSKFIRLDVTKGGNVTNVHTSADADKAIQAASDESLKNQFFSHFHDESAPTATIPRDGHEYVLMLKQGHKNLLNDFKGYDSKTLKVLKNTTAAWRWATLMARPAWLVNNIAGNTVQALTAGAGPVSFTRALRTGDGQKYEGVIRPGVENAGQFKNVFDQKRGPSSLVMKPIHAFTNAVVDANVRFENFARRAVDISQATREAKAQVHSELGTIRSGFHRVNAEVVDAMRNPSPEAEARIVKHVDTWLGNFTKLKQTPILDVISPFHRWFFFISKLVAEMPAKTPGRALLLQRLGTYGINIQNQEFGGFTPNSLVGSLKLPDGLRFVGGLYKSTQGLWPYTTPFQLLAPNDQSTTNPGQPNLQGALGALNPGFGALWNAGRGTDFQTGYDLQDQYGNPTGTMNPSVFVHGLENSIPFYSMVHGYNTADNSVNPIHPAAALTSATAQQPASLGLRALGYLGGSVRPFDPELNRDKSILRLKAAVIQEAKNKLAHS